MASLQIVWLLLVGQCRKDPNRLKNGKSPYMQTTKLSCQGLGEAAHAEVEASLSAPGTAAARGAEAETQEGPDRIASAASARVSCTLLRVCAQRWRCDAVPVRWSWQRFVIEDVVLTCRWRHWRPKSG